MSTIPAMDSHDDSEDESPGFKCFRECMKNSVTASRFVSRRVECVDRCFKMFPIIPDVITHLNKTPLNNKQ